MIFARYIGASKSLGFTVGKVYAASPELTGDTVSFNTIELTNDDGILMVLPPSSIQRFTEKEAWEKNFWEKNPKPGNRERFLSSNFEFLEEVYAVVTRPFDDHDKGEVLVVNDANCQFTACKDVYQYYVKGIGFRSVQDLVLLDKTNVFPGVVIKEENTGRWREVSVVDESLWVTLKGETSRRSPEEFRFPVDRDGDLLVAPLMECVAGDGHFLTEGRWYMAVKEVFGLPGTIPSGLIYVMNDEGKEESYNCSRFRM